MDVEETREQSIIEDDSPDVTIDSKGKVTLLGEEIPEDVKVDDSPVVEETPPKTEEPVPDAEPAPDGTGDEVVLTDAEKAFAANPNLVKRFGSVEQMIERQGETDKYLTDLERQRNYHRDQATPKEEPKVEAPSFEDFNEDPVGTIGRIVQDQLVGVNKRLSDGEYNAFKQSKSDFADMDPLMQEQLNQNPELQSLGYRALPILYKMAKADQIARAKAAQPVPAAVPKPDKTHAETSTGKKEPVLPKDTLEYYKNMSLKEIEAEVGHAPQRE